TGTSPTLALANVQTSVACSATFVRRLSVTGVMPPELSGSFTVTTTDPNGTCSGPGCTVDAGLAATITAPDVKGYRFVGWFGGACTPDTQTITVTPTDGDVKCTARYVLRVHATATASGATATFLYMSASTAASCDANGCTVDVGSDVTLTAEDLAPGYRFTGWSGGAGCARRPRARTITISSWQADTACGASYIGRVTETAGVQEGIGQGATISSKDPNAVCAGGKCTVDAGQSVTLTAPMVDGVRFLGWIGDGPCQ